MHMQGQSPPSFHWVSAEARPDRVAQGLSGREAEVQGPESSRLGLWLVVGNWKRFWPTGPLGGSPGPEPRAGECSPPIGVLAPKGHFSLARVPPQGLGCCESREWTQASLSPFEQWHGDQTHVLEIIPEHEACLPSSQDHGKEPICLPSPSLFPRSGDTRNAFKAGKLTSQVNQVSFEVIYRSYRLYRA